MLIALRSFLVHPGQVAENLLCGSFGRGQNKREPFKILNSKLELVQDRLNPSTEVGVGHEIPPLTLGLLTTVSCWEREFPLRV